MEWNKVVAHLPAAFPGKCGPPDGGRFCGCGAYGEIHARGGLMEPPRVSPPALFPPRINGRAIRAADRGPRPTAFQEFLK